MRENRAYMATAFSLRRTHTCCITQCDAIGERMCLHTRRRDLYLVVFCFNITLWAPYTNVECANMINLWVGAQFPCFVCATRIDCKRIANVGRNVCIYSESTRGSMRVMGVLGIVHTFCVCNVCPHMPQFMALHVHISQCIADGSIYSPVRFARTHDFAETCEHYKTSWWVDPRIAYMMILFNHPFAVI